MISIATDYLDTAVEGTGPFQYAPGSKAVLQAAVDVAQLVLEDADATQVEINQAAVTLGNAINAFESTVVVE